MRRKILIIRTDRIGDVVLTTPAIKLLRQAYPQAQLTMLVSKQTAALVRGLPYLDEVIIDDKEGENKGLLGFLKLCRRIRFLNPDVAIIYHTKNRYNWACYLAGVKERLGYKNNKSGFLLTQPVKDDRHLGQKHEADYCVDLLRQLGIKGKRPEMSVAVNKTADEWAKQWFEQHVPVGFGVVCIHAGASDLTKCWPRESFEKLIAHLKNVYMVKIILIGQGKTKVINQAIVQVVGGDVLDLSEQCSIEQTVSLLRRSSLLISNDSGPVHIAAAVGCPVISLFLRRQQGLNPERWRPLGEQAMTIVSDEARAVKVNQKSEMISGEKGAISVEEVAAAVDILMRRNTQAQFSW